MPESWSRENTTFTLHPSSLTFDPDVDCDVIEAAVARYGAIVSLFKEERPTAQGGSDLTKVQIRVQDKTCERFPHLNMDEACEC